MLIHIRPMMYSYYPATIIDLDLHPFDLHLVAGKDLNVGHPYPNRHYTVGCRKDKRKITDGILVETSSPIQRIRTTARWAVDGERVITHVVDYEIVDQDFDAVSDDTVLWLARWNGWRARWDSNKRPQGPCVFDETLLQTNYFPMPTLERERLTGERFPATAFRV